MPEPKTVGEMVEAHIRQQPKYVELMKHATCPDGKLMVTVTDILNALRALGLWDAKIQYANTVYDEAEVCVDGGIPVIVIPEKEEQK